MPDESYGPKPDPGVRMVSWPTLIAWRIWVWLSWPWQVRQMKAMGFRRVGWMTWELAEPSEEFRRASADFMDRNDELLRRLADPEEL